jgi:hypothetical protein
LRKAADGTSGFVSDRERPDGSYSVRSFAFACSTVCHCMSLVSSRPPCFRETINRQRSRRRYPFPTRSPGRGSRWNYLGAAADQAMTAGVADTGHRGGYLALSDQGVPDCGCACNRTTNTRSDREAKILISFLTAGGNSKPTAAGDKNAHTDSLTRLHDSCVRRHGQRGHFESFLPLPMDSCPV